MQTNLEAKLPQETVAALRNAEPRFSINRFKDSHVARLLAILDGLPPQAVIHADRELRWLLNLYSSDRGEEWDWRPNFMPTARGLLLLSSVAGIEYIFLFHANGHLREAALRKIIGGVRSPFFFAAITLRLNDWAAPVRRAAAECADRTFPRTIPEIIIEAAPFALAQRYEWGRWSATESAPLDQALGQRSVATEFAEWLSKAPPGSSGKLLRSAIRGPAFDEWLPQLALNPRSPEIRRVALEAIIRRAVRWPDHLEREWLDKTMGRYRNRWVYASRSVDSPMSVEQAMLLAARDTNATVRRVAVVALLTYGRALPGFEAASTILKADKNIALRERTEFALTMSE